MAAKKKITKFVCPKCNAQKKTFAESAKEKIACFRCNTTMVPKAEDLSKPEPQVDTPPKSASADGRAEPEQALSPNSDNANSDNANPAIPPTDAPDVPKVPTNQPSDYSSIQTTTQDINLDGYGVVVTDTGMTLGSVEVSTFRFSDDVASNTDAIPEAEPTVPNLETPPAEKPSPSPPTTHSPKDSANERGDQKPSDQETESLDQTSREGSSKEADPLGSNPNVKGAPDEALDVFPVLQAAEKTFASRTENPQTPQPKQASKKQQQQSKSAAAKASKKSGQRPKSKDRSNEATRKKAPEAATPKPIDSVTANGLVKQAEKPVGIPAPENLLPTTFTTENKWFQEMIAFTKSSELMLRYLVVALLTGLGLSFVVGNWTFIAAIGYVVALPGLFVLAVTGADITKQTILGCRSIEQWTSWDIRQILNQSLLVIISFVFAVIPGALLSIPFILSTSSYILTAVFAALSFLILFPMLMLSMIENGSNAQPFSATIFNSIKTKTKNWWNFFGASLLSAFLAVVFSFFITFGGGFLVCFFATLGISMLAFVYFRILGFHYRTLFLQTPEPKK